MAGEHRDLVALAARWLRGSARVCRSYGDLHVTVSSRCRVVLTEMVSAAPEIPDAIGWFCCGLMSIVVECKTSRSDFLADQKKSSRSPGRGMGAFRYYLAPNGLISPEELPDKWGLLVPSARGVTVVRLAKQRDEYNVRGERTLLVSALARTSERTHTSIPGEQEQAHA